MNTIKTMTVALLLSITSIASANACVTLAAGINGPRQVCFSQSEVTVLGTANQVLDRFPLVVTPHEPTRYKSSIVFTITTLNGKGQFYQVGARLINNSFSFGYLRDLKTNEVFKEYVYNPNAGRPDNGCGRGGRCR